MLLHLIARYGNLLREMNELLTVKQVMGLLQVDRTTVYRMVKDGRLAGVKIGQQWRFSSAEVDALVTGAGAAEDEPPAPPMSVLPLHCIQPIQDVFAEIAQVGSVTTAPDGEPLTDISNSCRFCNIVLESESGRSACIASWRRLADQPERRPAFATCHAGLQYARARIDVAAEGQNLTAMLIAGQFYAHAPRPDEEAARVRALAADHGLDADALQEAARELPTLDDHTRARIGGWLERVAHTFEEIGRERADLLGRLVRIARESHLPIDAA